MQLDIGFPWAARGEDRGIHESCAAAMRLAANSQTNEWAHLDDDWEAGGWAAKLRDLPTMHE
eukprot:12428625-Karenia_brevis.AAC.1